MRKNYRRAARDQRQKKDYRSNTSITAPEVRLIDENGEHAGVVTIEDAVRRAQELEMDLIEIEPKAEPPVCKIMDFGKLRYEMEKELRKQKARQKKTEVKGIRLSLRIGQHDRDVRLGQAQKFLEQDDKVKLEMVLRGRERQHADLARTIISEFVASLEERGVPVALEAPISVQGGRLSAVIGAKK